MILLHADKGGEGQVPRLRFPPNWRTMIYMSHKGSQFDTAIEIITPENIAFRYRVAGPFRRLPAYLIDLAIRIGMFVAGAIALGIIFGFAGLGAVGTGATLVLWFLLAWFYGGLFETLWNGQTPGKRLMQVRVLSVDGQPIGGLQAVLRNVLRVIDMQPAIFYQLGLLAATMNDRFQRLGDLACGTMVVVEERQWFRGIVRSNQSEAIRLAGLVPAGFQASRTLSNTLAAYVHRRAMFSWARRIEIARHLAQPLRDKFNLPPDTDLDLLLCGLYHRTFVTDRQEEPIASGSPFAGGSPFRESPGAVMARLDHGSPELSAEISAGIGQRLTGDDS